MSEMDIRLHHHLAQEFYRQQMLQRIPGNHQTSLNHHHSSRRRKQLEMKIFVYEKTFFLFGDGNRKTNIFV